MNKNKDEWAKKLVEEVRKGNENSINELFFAYHYILDKYIKHNKLKSNEIENIEKYFLNSIKLFAKYEYGSNLLPYLYNRLLEYNKIKSNSKSNINIKHYDANTIKEEDFSNKDSVDLNVLNKNYNKYYYIICDYILEYDYDLKPYAIKFAQKLLKKAIRKLLEDNKKITELNLIKYFQNFDFQFKKDLGNVDIILNDIRNGKSNYEKIIFEKYEFYISDVMKEINGTEYDKKVFEMFLRRIVNDYNKGILKTKYTMNSYIFKNLEIIKNNLIVKSKNFNILVELLRKGNTEYMYSVYKIFDKQIQKSCNNSKYDKKVIKDFAQKLISDTINESLKEYNVSNIDIIKKQIDKKISMIDELYYMHINKSSIIPLKSYMFKIRRGCYSFLNDLVTYFKLQIMRELNYSYAEKDAISDLLYKLLTVDINDYLYKRNYVDSYGLDRYIERKTPNYKDILGKYLNELEENNYSLDDIIILAKTNKKYIFIIYLRMKEKLDTICNGLLTKEKENNNYDLIAQNLLYNSIKHYINVAKIPNLKDLYNYIYNDFDWFNDLNKKITR